MELALPLLQTALNIIEVMGTFMGGIALVAIAVCAIIHIVRTNPERQARAFREVFKIRGN